MKNIFERKLLWFIRSDSGAIAAMTGLLMTVLLGFLAFAFDIGHLTLVKSEMQRTADAAALAGVRGLYPDDLPVTDPTKLANFTPDTAQAFSRATLTLSGNVIDGQSLGNDQVIIQAGKYDWTTKDFTSGAADTNAVLVEIPDYLVKHTFAPVLGKNNSKVTTKALAVMDYVSELPPGTMPIAIGKKYLTEVNKPLTITFDPATSDTGGWFAKPPDSASASTLKDYIDNGSCPSIKKGDTINLNNGDITVAMQTLETLANQFGLKNKGGSWDVDLPVVDSTQFNENKPIESFVKFRITLINSHGKNKRVEGTILGLGLSKPGGKPGGPSSPLLAPPRLVAYN